MNFSIANIFGNKPAAVPPQQAPQNFQQVPPGNNPAANAPPVVGTAVSPGTAPNGVVPDNANNPSAPPVSPLDQFAKVWEPKAVDPNASVDPNTVPITPEQFMEAAGKIDFSKAIPQETLAKITAGGPEAAAAFMEAINKVNQMSFGQSLAGAQKLVTRSIEAARKDFTTNIPKAVRSQNVRENLSQKNANLSHPAVAPVFNAIQAQLADQYPTASEAELQQRAEEYITNMGKAFAPTPAPAKQEVPKEEDWSDLA